MKISNIVQELDLEVRQDDFEDAECTGAYTSDLLSDVMANAHETDMLITIQSHKNTVAVATLVGASAIVVCNNRPVPEDMIDAARQEQIAILVSSRNQFTVSGMLYNLLQR
jgi:serine kinase of HPr protein (carbohydrate metabolism regulator)